MYCIDIKMHIKHGIIEYFTPPSRGSNIKLRVPLQGKVYRGFQYLVEGSPAVGSTTETWNLLIFDWKLVIISDFLSKSDISLRVDNYLLTCAETDHFSIAIGLQETTKTNYIYIYIQ